MVNLKKVVEMKIVFKLCTKKQVFQSINEIMNFRVYI